MTASPRLALLAALLLIITACTSTESARDTSTPAPPASEIVAPADDASVVEDGHKGRCDRPEFDFEGQYESVQACERGDLEAGNCAWYGAVDRIAACELAAADTDALGAFIRELRQASAGKVRAVLSIRGPLLQLAVRFPNLEEWRRWQARHQDETLTRALTRWARVYHRNHRVVANACVEIANEAPIGDAQSAWDAREDGPYFIIAERCEGD